MRAISIHVQEDVYDRIKRLAAEQGRPAAELIREAMAKIVDDQRPGHSIFDIKPHDSGPQLSSWTRDEIFDEMIDGR